MIDSPFINTVVDLGLIILVALLIPCTWRVIVGPSPADRLQGIDTLTTVLLGIVVLLVLQQKTTFLMDIALALAAFSFVATVAIARYIHEGRMF